jgi:hypothetical protein
MNNSSKVFMAFASGTESTESIAVKRYIGIAPVFVKALNPTKEELSEIYGTTIEKDIEYTGTRDSNGKEVPFIRLDFIVETDAERCDGIEMKTKVTYFLSKEFRYNSDKTKVMVINKYGETTWLTLEDAKNGNIPSNLSWFDPAEMRPAYVGEEELTLFLKSYLGIPNKSYRDNQGVVHEIPNKSDAEARLDNINEYFNGNISELKAILKLQPNNKVKFAFGVKTTDDNKMYQDVYIQKPLKNGVTNYTNLEKDITARQQNGGYPNTVFEICPLREYSLEPTTFSPQETTVDADEVKNWFTV